MKYTRFILIGLIAVVSVLFVMTRNKQDSHPQRQANESRFETKVDEQGQVTIKVAPQVSNSAQWKFTIVFDTHSVELNQDLLQIAVLTDDQGNTYKPTAWEGPGPGGHHREGILLFESISPTTSYVELRIKNIGGIPERLFKWDTR